MTKYNGSMVIAIELLGELTSNHRAQLKIVQSLDSAINGVAWALSSLKDQITKAEDITTNCLSADLLPLSASQCNSLNQFLADCRCLKSFLDNCDLLQADLQYLSHPEGQKEDH